MIEQAKFTYSPLGKAFWKPNKNDSRTMKKTRWSFKSFKAKYYTQKIAIRNVTPDM